MQPRQIRRFAYSWYPAYGQYQSFTYSCDANELTMLDPDLPDHFQLGTRAIPRPNHVQQKTHSLITSQMPLKEVPDRSTLHKIGGIGSQSARVPDADLKGDL
jgi:hypothetical protein